MSKKEAYLAIAKAKLDEQIAKLELLKEKAKDEFDEQKVNTQELMDDLEEKIASGKVYMGKLSETAEEKWDQVKDGFEALSDNIGGTIGKLLSRLKKTEDEDSDQPKDSA